MRKLQISVAIAIAMVALAVASLSVALAQKGEGSDAHASKIAVKLAEILELDAVVVDDAIKQAHRELRDDVVQEKLSALVEKDQLTQEQANEYFSWIQSMPGGVPAIRKNSFSSKGHFRRWGGRGHFSVLKGYFIGKSSLEDVGGKLRAAIANGEITEEEAREKLGVLRAKESR